MTTIKFPDWADEMRSIFRSSIVSQFIVYGNINDYVAHTTETATEFLSLKEYLNTVLFAPFDVVITFDRGQGIQVLKGENYFFDFLRIFDYYHGTKMAPSATVSNDAATALSMMNLLPRNPVQALEIIDRFLNSVRAKNAKSPKSAAVILDYAHFIVPQSETIHLTGDIGSQIIKILSWAEDATYRESGIMTCLLTENLIDIHNLISTSSHNAKIRIALPDEQEIEMFTASLFKAEPAFNTYCKLDAKFLADRLIGLSRVAIKSTLFRAVRNNLEITPEFLAQIKKESIEKEAAGKLDFLESKLTLENVAGHKAVKTWLREDATLMKKGVTAALPMGYLISGRIGTGKTYLVKCFAGECGVPFVELKNFRDKWVGATEGNLEKIFSILHALGSVVVFVDEADQATGKRSAGDETGISGRVYAMLAKEMSDTANRGKIIWIFATSRPDLVEIDLKRQGRLDVHIPLFPPESDDEKKQLFVAMARKLGIPITEEDIPELPFAHSLGGNEIEGLLVRTLRIHALQEEGTQKPFGELLKEVISGFKPSAHTRRLELMDYLAVKECTDSCFLPQRFAELSNEEIEAKIVALM
jgi:SpoVK/Ycf46/Vps4 family AAA+-type ATPase